MNRIVKNTIIVLLVALGFLGSVRATTSQTMTIQLPWYLKVSPAVVNTGVPQCWATFTVSVTGSTDLNIRIIFTWLSPVSSGNLYYDETLSTVGRKAPFQFDVVVEGFPGLTTTYNLEVSAHVDSANNVNWFDYSLGGLNQKATVTIITPSQYPPGGYCAHYTYTLATTHATMTYTTIDMRSPTTTYTQTWTYGTTTYGWWDWWWNWQWWTQWWPWQGEFDFSLAATPDLQSMKAGQSVSFTVAVELVSGIAQPVTLSLTGLPGEMSNSFSMQSADPRFTSALQVSSQASLSPGTYTLTIVGNGGGKTHSTSVNLIIARNMQPSSLSLSVNPSVLQVGESVALGGALDPGSATTLEIVYARPDGFELTKHVITSNAGAFSDAFKPDTPGPWSVKARWPGDANHYACESQLASFSVTGVPEKPPQPFWEQIPPVVVLAAILAVIIVGVVLLRHRTTEKKTQPAATAIFCVKCGKAIPEGSGYCTNCGEKLR
jgi:hypothetical protein